MQLPHARLGPLLPPSQAQAAVDAVALQMQQLERQCPGSCARLLSEAMLQLSISDNPLLAKLQAAARGLFGSSSSGGGAAAAAPPPSAAGPGGAPALAGPALPGPGGGSSKPAVAGAAGPPGAGAGPDLGLLGNFLLARWREDVARSAAAAARSRAAL
jgi:hypothetical protein